MKNYYLSILILTAITLSGCSLDFNPSDEISSDILLKQEGGAECIIDGCYATLKDPVHYIQYSGGNSFVCHYYHTQEFPTDNVTLSGITTDALYNAYSYKMTDDLKSPGVMWWLSYKVCYMANTVIETLKEGENANDDQLLGEAYFLRGFMHQTLLWMFSKPYCLGRDNLGVVIRTSTNTSETKRATVGECYDQVVKDLIKAASLMKEEGRGNGGYACKNTALGLLSRMYLYMGQDDKVIEVVQGMLGGSDGSDKLEPSATFPTYFANAVTSKETLFCIAHTALETQGQASVGSMYINDGMGWGEVYASNPVLDLYERYPEDLRYTSFIIPQVLDSTKMFVTFADPDTPEPLISGRVPLTFQVTPEGENYTFMEEGTKYVVKKVARTNPEYNNEWEVTFPAGGQTWPARVTYQMKNRNNYFQYYVTKFSYQDGDPMLSSPVILRWGEVILNLAEAYAHLGDVKNATKYVNVMRRRACIREEGMFSETQMHGYTDILDVVMDERRLELAFEADRRMDVYGNKKAMNRLYPGCHPYEIIDYTADKIQYPIPFGEYTISGIERNPGY